MEAAQHRKLWRQRQCVVVTLRVPGPDVVVVRLAAADHLVCDVAQDCAVYVPFEDGRGSIQYGETLPAMLWTKGKCLGFTLCIIGHSVSKGMGYGVMEQLSCDSVPLSECCSNSTKELHGAVRRLTVIVNRTSMAGGARNGGRSEPMRSLKRQRTVLMSTNNRPVDVMSFLTNDDWMIDDEETDVHLDRYSKIGVMNQDDLMKDHKQFESENAEYEIRYDDARKKPEENLSMQTLPEDENAQMDRPLSRQDSLGTTSSRTMSVQVDTP